MKKRVVIIGLDGMYWKLLEDLCKQGLMPFVNSKLSKSSRGTLLSTLPPYTPPAWNSIASGVYPNKHGIWGFFKVKKTENNFQISLASSYDVKYPRIWEMLSLFNKKSIIVNVPVMFPFRNLPRKENYILATGWDAPYVDVHPKEIRTKYKSLLLPYFHKWSQFSETSEYINLLSDVLKARGDALLALSDEFDWDFVFVVFSEPDWLLHRFIYESKDLTIFSKVFKEIDRIIEQFSNKADLTILTSDHGFDMYTARFHVNSYLSKRKLISFSVGYETKFGEERIKENITRWKIGKRVEQLIKNNRLIKGTLRMTQKVNFRLYVKFLRLLIKLFKFSYTIDGESTVAFSPEFGVVYVKDGYSAYIKRVLEETNFVNVIETTQLFNYTVKDTPDLIVLPKNHILPTSFIAPRDKVLEKVKVPYHSMHGIFLAIHNDGDVYNKDLGFVNTVDIVPTVLSFMGLPIPSDTDGRNLLRVNGEKENTFDYASKWKVITGATRIKRKLSKLKLHKKVKK